MREAIPWRWVTIAVLTLVVAVAAWHYWTIASGLTGARDHLLAAQRLLSDTGVNLEQADLAIARSEVEAAEADLDDARAHMKWDPLLALGQFFPIVGTQIDAAYDLADIAGLLVDVAGESISAGAKAVALRDAPPSGQPLTKSLVDLLDDTTPEVERIDALLQEAVELRIELGDDGLIGPLAGARDRLDEELPDLANSVEQLLQSKDLLPAFLGFEGDRRYLMLALNNGELLPGGGLVTASGILPVSQGVNGPLEFTDSVKWLGTAGAMGVPYIEPPGPLKRYLLRSFSWNLLVSNWSPDFPTWAQQALEFHEIINGDQGVQGVIAVDLEVLQRLLAVTGPKTIEVEGVGPVVFDSNNAVLVLESLTRQPFEPTDDRKSVIGDLAEQVLADLLALPSDKWSDAVEVIRDLGEQRHIQVFSFDAEEQTIVRDFRWDGRLEEPSGDFVHFNEASVLSTKLNLIMQPEGSYSIALDELGNVEHELRLVYANTLPEWSVGKDPALVQQLMLGGLYGGYLRVFGPRGISAYQVDVDGGPGNVDDAGADGAADWFGTFVPVPPGETRNVTMRWRSTARGSVSAEGYRLYIQKQPGTHGMCLDIDVSRAGRPPSELVIDGGDRDEQGRVCMTSDVKLLAIFD